MQMLSAKKDFPTQLLYLSILSGLLLWLSWPSRGVPIISFVALIPLLSLEDYLYQHKHKYRPLVFLAYSWLSFIIFNALTTWWIALASVPGVMVAIVINAFLMALPFFFMHLGRRVLPGKIGASSLVFLWLTFEYLHLDWDMSWSWLNLGNAFANMPILVQWYEYTGALGGTVWIIVMNLLFFNVLKTYQEKINPIELKAKLPPSSHTAETKIHQEYFLRREHFVLLRKRAILGLLSFLVLTAPLVWSVVLWNKFEPSEESVEVLVLQSNRDPYVSAENHEEVKEIMDELIGVAESQITKNTRYVLAPEISLPAPIWLHRKNENYAIQSLRQHLQTYDSLSWIAGALLYQYYEEGQDKTPSARSIGNSNNWYDVYNAAVFLNAAGEFDWYAKSILVPGIEQMPFYRYLKNTGKLVEKFGGTSGGMAKRSDNPNFTGMDGLQIGPAVCYESIYGSFIGEKVRNGADLIFILTNDGWWGNTPGYRQHHHYARLRAIEHRRSIARSAKTGISSLINPKGEILQQTTWYEGDFLLGDVSIEKSQTFYSMHGDYLGRLSFFLTALFLFYIVSRTLIKKNN